MLICYVLLFTKIYSLSLSHLDHEVRRRVVLVARAGPQQRVGQQLGAGGGHGHHEEEGEGQNLGEWQSTLLPEAKLAGQLIMIRFQG